MTGRSKATARAALIAAGMGMMAAAADAAVVSFTPSGTATVSQSTDLYWDMLSGATSTSGISGAPGGFQLSGHGDFHFNSTADMVNVGSSDGGQNLSFGTTIGAASNFSFSGGYVGTDGFGGQCTVGNTCYYGLRFQLSGNTHYGWVQFSEDAGTQSLIAWGYETTAGASIAAGDTGASAVPLPAAMPLLAFGLGALAANRRRARAT